MTITLINTSGRCQVFTLTHEHYCVALGECACAAPPSRQASRLPTSLTLPAGATVASLPSAVLTVPDVVTARRRGELTVLHAPPAPRRERAGVAPIAPTVAPATQRQPASPPSPSAYKRKRGP